MSRKDDAKKKKVAGIAAATAAVVGVIYALGVMPLRHSLASAEEQIEDAQSKLSKHKFAVQKTVEIETSLKEITERLDQAEASIPKGDAYLWMLDNIQVFREKSGVEFNQVDAPRAAEPNSLPVLPYVNMAYGIAGAAYYSDFGFFLADFENKFPFARIRTLELEPTAAGRSEDEREKLRFRLEFVTPAKSAESLTPPR